MPVKEYGKFVVWIVWNIF